MTRCFQAGGTVQEGAFYVERPADKELLDALLRHEFCYLLEPRQIGKSSLRARMQRPLSLQGVRCANIDLTGIGASDVSEDDWYFGLMEVVTGDLDLGDAEEFWERHAGLTPVGRWSRFLRDEVLAGVSEPLVLFIDEIGSLLDVPWDQGEFFASLMEVYDSRPSAPVYDRLTFCLIGVAGLEELAAEASRTLFRRGRRIRLADFTRHEAEPFLPGLEPLGGDAGAWLDAIMGWTNGHPYMTQRIGQVLSESGAARAANEQAGVDQVVDELFLRPQHMEDYNLAAVEDQLFEGEDPHPLALPMLQLYGRVLEGESVPAVPEDPVQMGIRLAGMVAERPDASGAVLMVRNRIFATVFNHDWVTEQESRLRALQGQSPAGLTDATPPGDDTPPGRRDRAALHRAAGS
jgi:AAA-like domain